MGRDLGVVRPLRPLPEDDEVKLIDADEVGRFWAKVVVDCACDCWVWVGARTAAGYGQLNLRYRRTYAHRAAYETWRGPIPDGLHIDHLCRVRACANPWHMEPVTREENWMRGVGAPAVNARKTHCDYGHPIEGPEAKLAQYKCLTILGRRSCLICERRRQRERYHKRKAAHAGG